MLSIIVFTGSVFLTSGKFVDAINTPKFYFVLFFLSVSTVIITLSQKRIKLRVFDDDLMIWGINIVCFLQACYGLFQFVGWLPSNYSRFSITGSFENPAGFTAVLAIGFPIGLHLLVKVKRVEKYIATSVLIIILVMVFLSGSRTGLLAILVSSFMYSLLQTNFIGKFQELKFYKLLSALVLSLLVAGALMLYYQKKNSANGRLLIWEISTVMIKDKPVFGHGYGAFKAKYMDYQAEYFKNNPDSKYAQLADNVKHPFNEFIKVAVEFGIVGLIVVLSLFLFVLWETIKSKHENRGLVFSGLLSFLVVVCFSYPLQYIAVWLLLAFYLFALLPPKEIRIRNTPVSIIARIAVAGICIFSLFHIYQQIRTEIKWKTIAVNSLRGNTEKMLPEYEKLYSTSLKRNPFFLYNYGAELNYIEKFDKSINVLTECKKRFNDYDLQMLLADNYNKKGETERAIEIYRHASFMIPCRFLPIYQLFEIYKNVGQKDMAVKYANEIVNKKVKIPSITVMTIQSEAKSYLNETN